MFSEYEVKQLRLPHLLGKTQLFHLIFTEPEKVISVQPCIDVNNVITYSLFKSDGCRCKFGNILRFSFAAH